MPVLPSLQTVALAHFKPLAGEDKNKSFRVHFNPASLQYTVANTQDPQKKNGNGVQFVSQSTAKLTMDLVFDTTPTGADVRDATNTMVNLLRPYQDGGGKVPPSVEFSWGAYTFTGIVEQYKETMDFFSSEGVPLRASINLTMASNSLVFTSSKDPEPDPPKAPEPVVVPDSAGPSSVANSLGDPRAARAIASASGSASLRFGGGASLAVAGSVSLSPPAAFSAGGGLGLSAGAGIGVGGGIGGGIGIGGGVGIGGGAGLSVTATAGAAFTGLRVAASASTSSGVTNARALLPPVSISSGGSAGFDLGGAARANSGGSLSADVGASADLSARIGFSD